MRLILPAMLLVVAACTGTTAPSPAPADPTARPSPASPRSESPPLPTAPATVQPEPPTPAVPTTAPPTASVPPATSPPATAPPETVPPTGEFDPDAIRLSLEPFASGFSPLTFVTHAGDGSGMVYAVEQRGVIWLLDAGGSIQPTPFLDISDRIRAGGERGLLGLAFHPQFESNGRFFVNYTNRAGNTVVSEFARGADGGVDAASERMLLGINQPFSNHNGGMIEFGPGGYLYIAAGDGGSAGDPQGNGQSLATHLGKMLRIDVDSGDPYGIPPDNPFADGSDGLPEIWSYGLRNPWRFSFDRATGAMFIGDVGQSAREEIDAEPAGEGGRNYGWDIMEGDRCYEASSCQRSGLTMPVAAFGRDGNCSVTGGYVYRGGQHAQLFGGYVFSDYCSGTLWALDADAAVGNGSARIFVLGDTDLNPSSFGEDEAGELFIVNHGGDILRLIAQPR